jgi:hypothetical protein
MTLTPDGLIEGFYNPEAYNLEDCRLIMAFISIYSELHKRILLV